MIDGKYSVAAAAALIADPSRAAALIALLDGTARPASELALLAHASPQAMSLHLAKLTEGRLLVCTRRGRYRHYRLAGSEVATALEAMGVLSTAIRPIRPRPGEPPPPMRMCRACYDHLAGIVGVRICDALLGGGFLREHDGGFAVTRAGTRFFADAGWAPARDVTARRVLARPCLDWTERRHHLAGALGASMLTWLLEHRWIRRDGEPRVMHLTPQGAAGLRRLLGPAVDPLEEMRRSEN